MVVVLAAISMEKISKNMNELNSQLLRNQVVLIDVGHLSSELGLPL
jgi:hypothetical protein